MLALAQAAATCVLGVGSIWFARKGARQTRAVGNGFADEVLGLLNSLTHRLDRLEKKVDDKLP